MSKPFPRPTLTISGGKSFALVIALLYFIGSLYVYPHYIFGDQYFYRLFYQDVINLGYSEGFIYFQDLLGSAEPIYFLLVKVFAGIISKDLLMSILNGALIYSLIIWANRNNVSWLVIVLLALNFYLLVLLFSTERLKFAMLLLMLAVNTNGVKKPILAVLSFLSHTQVLFLTINWLTLPLVPVVERLAAGQLQRKSWKILPLLALFSLVVIFMMEHMQDKFSSYATISSGFGELFKPTIFLVLTFFYAKRKRVNAFVIHFPLLIGAYFIGSDRIVIFSYFVFLNYALRFKRGLNLAVVITSLYFIYQGAEYLDKIFTYGDGFFA